MLQPLLAVKPRCMKYISFPNPPYNANTSYKHRTPEIGESPLSCPMQSVILTQSKLNSKSQHHLCGRSTTSYPLLAITLLHRYILALIPWVLVPSPWAKRRSSGVHGCSTALCAASSTSDIGSSSGRLICTSSTSYITSTPRDARLSVARRLRGWLENQLAGNTSRTRKPPTAGSLETGKDEVPFGACALFAGFAGNCEVVAAAEPCEVTLLAGGCGMPDVFCSVFIAGFMASWGGTDACATESERKYKQGLIRLTGGLTITIRCTY